MSSFVVKAVDKDVPSMVELIVKLREHSSLSAKAPLALEKTIQIIMKSIDEGLSFVSKSKEDGEAEGLLVATVGELLTSIEKTGVILCWWVSPTKAGFKDAEELLNQCQEELKKQGVKNVAVSLIGPIKSKAVEKFYKKKGFTEGETIFVKEIN